MTTSKQCAVSPGVDTQHFTSSNINLDPLSSQSDGGHSTSRRTDSEIEKSPEGASLDDICHAAAGLDEVTSAVSTRGNCSTKDEISEEDYQATNREARMSQQAGLHGITKNCESSAQSVPSVDTNISSQLLPSGAQLPAEVTRGTEASQVGTGNTLREVGSLSHNKRQREQISNLPAVDSTRSSDDGARNPKRSKVHYACEDVDSYWMTIKIGDLNHAIDLLDSEISLCMHFLYDRRPPGRAEIRKLISNLTTSLIESHAILESARQDVGEEIEIDRETTE